MTSTHKLVSRPALIAAGLAMTLFSALNAAEANTEKVLYSFGGTPDGDNPTGGLVMDERGNFYGTTSQRRRPRLRHYLQNEPGPGGPFAATHRWTVEIHDPGIGDVSEAALKTSGGRSCGYIKHFTRPMPAEVGPP